MGKNRTEKKYRKGKIGLLYAIVSVILIAAAIVAACVVFFRVEEVTVEGNSRYSEEQVRMVANVEMGSNLILAPREQIAQQIHHCLTYVDTVKIQKRFPTTLKIVITECQPVAVVPAADGQWIIDAKGKLLEKADETLALQYMSVKGLELSDPELGRQATVPQENAGQLQALEGLLSALQEEGLIGKISDIDISSKTEILMNYDNRFKVKFLINADFNRKIRVLQAIIPVLSDADRGTIDLKAERGYFIPG